MFLRVLLPESVLTVSARTRVAQTGRKPVRTGINFWIPTASYGLGLKETTLAQVLNARGFVSPAGMCQQQQQQPHRLNSMLSQLANSLAA